MTEAQKIQKELNEMNAAREAVMNQNKVESDFPKINRSYSYRKSISIRSL